MLSIEPSFSVFYEGRPVTDYAQAVLTKNPTRPWEWTNDYLLPAEAKEVSKELRGLIVRLYENLSLCEPVMHVVAQCSR
jgi:hypothetical protein